jgi:hypothetical protein
MWNEANSVNSHCGPLHELERMVLTPLQSLADVELQYSSRVDHSAKRMFFCQNPGWVVAHPVTHLPPPLVATDRSGGRYQHALNQLLHTIQPAGLCLSAVTDANRTRTELHLL